jgi:catechol 2,3-dioxygenase-like lactoylglutathione lyase family enzyme
MGNQTGCNNTGVHHVGLRAANPAASAEFYRDVLGMEIVGGSDADHPLGATAFLSSRPNQESHEIALFANPAFAHIRLQSLFTGRVAVVPRACCGEEHPDQVRSQPRRVLRVLFRRP